MKILRKSEFCYKITITKAPYSNAMIQFFFKSRLGIASALIVIAVIGAIVLNRLTSEETYILIEVMKGVVSEEVIVTGKTTPVDRLDLSFEISGKIARVRKDVGDSVETGEILAELDSAELSASLEEAEASARAQKAKLDELTRGTRAEDIQISRTNLLKAEQDLVNEYNGVEPILEDAYSKTDDAVRNQLSALFSNAESSNPQFTFVVNDSQIQIDGQSGRSMASMELNTWKDELETIRSKSSEGALETEMKNAGSRLVKILTFINKTMDAVINSPASAANTHRTSVINARSAVNAAISNINEKTQMIATQKIVVDQANDNLSLQLAGSTVEEKRTQEAQLKEAEANVAVRRVRLGQTRLRSPIGGVVAKMDAKTGETVSAHTIIASVISKNKFEIDVNIPEVDIGKISIGNVVSISFDAFPEKIFSGKVIKIDPAETIIDGVVNFKTVVGIETPTDILKSGLTANLSIETERRENVLMLPQEALIEKKQGTFVKKYENGDVKEYPVTIGIRDKNGNVEILSGIATGEQVVNIGLRTAK